MIVSNMYGTYGNRFIFFLVAPWAMKERSKDIKFKSSKGIFFLTPRYYQNEWIILGTI